MKFESVKCDECGRIQDGANHWMRMQVHMVDTAVELVAMGDIPADGIYMSRKVEHGSSVILQPVHDLCGQGCALKHLAKLLGWSQPADAAQEERA